MLPTLVGNDPINDLGFVVFPMLVGIVAGVFTGLFHYLLRLPPPSTSGMPMGISYSIPI